MIECGVSYYSQCYLETSVYDRLDIFHLYHSSAACQKKCMLLILFGNIMLQNFGTFTNLLGSDKKAFLGDVDECFQNFGIAKRKFGGWV